ncbi:N-acetyltransferase family protein [Mycobacterium sp. 2YAF39]|uniref:GNAT family N-acetyltransferase n=1 Tax=Mycobacterium sp. 2YAF39 TaxID=3233033 RepID=UPI003F99193A
MSHERLEELSYAELLDGDLITVRRLKPSDADGLVQLYERLSDNERYLRFFTLHPAHLQARARSLTKHSEEQYALGAFAFEKLLGVANYVACQTPGDAEVAIVVAHDEHLRGVGTALLRRLGEIAKSNDIHHLIADVLTQNVSMLHVLSDAGWPCARHRDGSVLHLEIDLDEAH